jgi:hypothetical protein
MMFRDESRLIERQPAGRHGGVAVADIDGDGRFEFIVAGRPNRVLKWSDGRLRDVAPRALAETAHPTLSIAAADIDGDGSEELYLATESGIADRLFHRDLNGHWSDLLSCPENRAVQNLAAGCAAAIDRRGAGRYAFVVAAAGQPLRLLEPGPHGVLVDLAPSLNLNATAGIRAVLAAPLSSAQSDLFCSVESGPNLLFRNLGNGAFEECGARLNLADAAEHSRCAVAVDTDGDGRPGLALCNQEGPHRLFQRQGEGAWRDRATPAFAFPSAAEALIAADFDNDGRDELFFNNRGQPNRLFRLGDEIVMLDPGPAAEVERLGAGAAVADIDGDGVLELLAAHGDGGPGLALYKSPLAAGHCWLRILPQTRFGAPARGAAVRAEIGGRTRVKAIDGGSGLCQMEPVAHFGLGRETRVDRVTVTWPDGSSLSFREPDLNSSYIVPCPRG